MQRVCMLLSLVISRSCRTSLVGTQPHAACEPLWFRGYQLSALAKPLYA